MPANTLTLLEGGFLTTVQDSGRPGYQRLGVPVSGAMDRFALLAANALVGNAAGAAALEFTLQGPALWLEQDGLVALAGCGFELRIGGRCIPPWMAAWARGGELLEVLGGGDGGWGCLAVAGGVKVPLVMGSRSTCLPGGFGGLDGRPLQAGDSLPLGAPPAPERLYGRAGLALPAKVRPDYAGRAVDVLPGPQDGRISEKGWRDFLEGAYQRTPAGNRMGYRLAGPPVELPAGADLLSEGIPLGALQVPGDGQPVALLADRQATGGYVKIGVIASASLPVLVQTPIGERVRFRLTGVEQAQAGWKRLASGPDALRDAG